MVQKAWLQGVMPAVVDSESTVQDKALEALDQVLLSHVKPYSPGRYLDGSQRLTWDLLGLLCHECQNLRLDIKSSLSFIYIYIKKKNNNNRKILYVYLCQEGYVFASICLYVS